MQPTRLLCPWDSPSMNAEWLPSSRDLLNPGIKPSVLHLLHRQAASSPLAPPRKPLKWSPISPVAVCCFVKCLYHSTSSQSTFHPQNLGSDLTGTCDWYWLRDINKPTTSRSLGSICTCLGCPLLLLGTICHHEVKQGLTSHGRRVPIVHISALIASQDTPVRTFEIIQSQAGQLVQTRKTAQCFVSTILKEIIKTQGFPDGTSGKEPTCHTNEGDIKRLGLDPWVRKIPWRGAWQPTTEFVPRESHGQRSLVGYHRVTKSWTQPK